MRIDNKLRRLVVLGVKVSAINMGDACAAIEESIIQKEKGYISVCPVSTVMECQRDPLMLTSVNSAALVTPDGMPIVWLARLRGFADVRRVYGPDLMLEICRISSQKGYRNYFYGSSQETISRLQEKLKILFPCLNIAGAYSPPYRPLSEAEDEEIIRMINNARADILWVGLGSPKQDIWMYQHRDKINVPVMAGVGAAFDFISGAKKQAPRFMQKTGTEWLFRLCAEPKRLWKRYVLGNTRFLYLLGKEIMKERCRRC